jgi:hypothetical protein
VVHGRVGIGKQIVLVAAIAGVVSAVEAIITTAICINLLRMVEIIEKALTGFIRQLARRLSARYLRVFSHE